MPCGDPTQNLTISEHIYQTGSAPTAFKFSASSVVTCRSGYKFSDGTFFNTINCTSKGSWSYIPDCISSNFLPSIVTNSLGNEF